MKDSPTLSMANKVSEAKARGLHVLSLSTPMFPSRSITIQGEMLDVRLPPPNGDLQSRELMAKTLFGHWNASADAIVVSAGAKTSLLCLYAALRKPESRVVCLTPAWPTYWQLGGALGIPTVFLQRKLSQEWGLETQYLIKDIRASDIVVISNPCNPTGRVYTPEEIQSLAEACESIGAWLILDESFSKTVESATGYFRPRVLYNRATVIVNSVSKNFLAQGWRLGAIHAHGTVLDLYVKAQTMLISPPAGILQSHLFKIIENQFDTSKLEVLRREVLKKLLSAGYQCAPAKGSFYLFPYKKGLGEKLTQAEKTLRAFSLLGTTFGLKDSDYLRLCLLQDTDSMEKIVDVLTSL